MSQENGKTFHKMQLNRHHLVNDDPESTIDSPQQFIFLLLKQILKFPHSPPPAPSNSTPCY